MPSSKQALVLVSCIPGKGITVLVVLKPEEVASIPFLLAKKMSVLLLVLHYCYCFLFVGVHL
jgi:hypothetical protein